MSKLNARELKYLEECREYLKSKYKQVTEEEALRLRNKLYMLANVVVESYCNRKNES